MRERERGAALLTVLLLVAVIATLAATALEKLHVSTRLATNARAIDQARGFALAAEVLATSRVSTLLAQNPDRISLAGGWSDKPFALPIPGGLATARVTDGGNCFNLNGLVVQSNGGAAYAAYSPAITQFARLMRLVNVRGPAESIAAATADWIDTDSSPLPGGAEDSSYFDYRTGGTLMADPSELRAVSGVTSEVYAAIRPWVCALPKAAPSMINVNTLTPEQAPLIAMLLPDTLSVAGARSLLLKRPALGFEAASDFWKLPALSAITADPGAQAQTAVTTKWFALKVDVNLGGNIVQERGVMDATQLPARLVSRQWGEPA